MNKSISLILILASAVPFAANAQEVPAVDQTQFSEVPENVRDYRYCEIIPVFRSGLKLRAVVYNTIALNTCPAELWDALDGEQIAQSSGAVTVKMNGPRFFVQNNIEGDESTSASERKTVDFGGIEMNQQAILEARLSQGSVGEKLYTDNEVQRKTTYTYDAGNMVYELTSPEGDVYRMQSYSQIIDPTLTIDDLEILGERLDLPEAWSYQARLLSEDSVLRVDGLAFVINDDLLNTYQKLIPSNE
jgi:hypothetical protein